MAVRTFAAIDVGSYELAMKIFEFTSKGVMRQVDHIRHRIELGTDTYHKGKISTEHMDELCRVLSEFKEIMDGYRVDAYKAYGTSAIRETQNTLIVTEQIMLRTGIKVDPLSNSEQRFLHYKAAASKGEMFKECIGEGCAIVDIGGGSIQISLFDNDSLVTTQNIRLGVLRTMDMLSMLQPTSRDYENVLKELIDNQLYSFKRLYLKNREIRNIILIDDYISMLMHCLGRADSFVDAATFWKETDQLHALTADEVASQIGIPSESAIHLRPSIGILSRVLKITKADRLWTPGVSLCDGIAYEYAEKEKLLKNFHDFEHDIVAGAYVMSKRYQGNKERNQLLEKFSVELFDATKRIHKMTKRDRLLLQIAAILNDCGRYVSIEAGAECGYSIIMATEMIGLSHMEREIVANVVRFNKVKFEYYEEVARHSIMDSDSYLRVAKLTAIFRVADGICRSYKDKVKGISVSLKDKDCNITAIVNPDDDIALEQGFFYRKSEFFEEVFAVKPILKCKKKI